MTTLKDKTIFMSGGSRGIGLAIALRAAQDGANIVIAAKTAAPPPTHAVLRNHATLTPALLARLPIPLTAPLEQDQPRTR